MNFHQKVFNGKTGLPFQSSSYFREFSSGMPNKSMIHLHPNRNFRNFLVNGKRRERTKRTSRKFVRCHVNVASE